MNESIKKFLTGFVPVIVLGVLAGNLGVLGYFLIFANTFFIGFVIMIIKD